MPSVSKKQHNLMAAVAKNPKFAKKVGIPQSVGEEFVRADKGKRFGTGGDVGYSYGGENQINKQRTRFGSKFGYKLNVPNENVNKYTGKKEGGTVKESKAMMKKEVSFMKKAGAPKSMLKHEMAEAKGMKKGGKAYAKGGMAECKTVAKKEVKSHEKRMHGMKSGGLAAGHKSADGIATKGKTKARQITMKKGGYC